MPDNSTLFFGLFPKILLVQQTITFARPEENSIEMEIAYTKVFADALLLLLGNIEPVQQLSVSVGRKLIENLPHGLNLLGAQQFIQLRWRPRGREQIHFFVICKCLAPGGTPAIVKDEIAGDTANEPRKPVGIDHLASTDAFNSNAQRILTKIFDRSSGFRCSSENQKDAASVSSDELIFCRDITGPDFSNEFCFGTPARLPLRTWRHFHSP